MTVDDTNNPDSPRSVRATIVRFVKAAKLEPIIKPVYRGAVRSRAVAGRAVHNLRVAARTARRSPQLARLSREYRQVLANAVTIDEVKGTRRPDALAIVMCLWNRPQRIDEILSLLAAQKTQRPLRLILWNNNLTHSAHYRDAIEKFTPYGALSSVEFVDSPYNIGGIARFVAMRQVVREGYTGPFVMIDDDQNVSPSFVGDLLEQWKPRSIASIWAFINDGKYWIRGQRTKSGESADHLGTGGCICDSELVTHEAFFTSIPMRFLFMEDIWMSHCATRNEWPLVSVASPVEFVLEEFDQGHAIYDEKEDFFSWLKKRSRIPLWEASVIADVAPTLRESER